MKKTIFTLALLFPLSIISGLFSTIQGQDTLWVRYDDRFKANEIISLQGVDSIEFRNAQLRREQYLTD